MKDTNNSHENRIIQKLIKNGLFFIFLGFAVRIFMLIYYYYIHAIDPGRTWGDIGSYFRSNVSNPPLSIFFLEIMRFLSFGILEIFVFWGFFWDLLSCIIFYFVLKSFGIKKRNYVYGLFLINPFFFLTNSFSIENCGYHMTDAFFLCFLFLALIYYPRNTLRSRYTFYIFLGLSMCAKYYSLPACGIFLIKYLYDKDWKELKIFLITMVPLVFAFLIIPFFYWKPFTEVVLSYPTEQYGSTYPFYIKVIPAMIIFLFFCFCRIKTSNYFEIIIISIIITGTFIFFSYPYLRWFQVLVIYGILKEKDFYEYSLNFWNFNMKIAINNQTITFALSTVALFIAYLFILYVH